MERTIRNISLVAAGLLAGFCFYSAGAQEKKSWNAVGGLLSPTNVGISFNTTKSHVTETSGRPGFHSVSVSGDMTSAFLGLSKYPGLQITYNYDFVLGSWESPLGKSWLYIGPGVALGYGDDWNMPMGHILGLNLQFGYDYLFTSSGIHLGAGVNPIFGYHLSRNEQKGGLDMRLYHYGFLRTLIPQCRILCDLDRVPRSSDGPRSEARFEEHRKAPLLTFGIEASGLLQLYDYHSYSYMSPYGREDDLYANMITRLAAQVYIHGGFNIKDFMNLSLLVGYQGLGYTSGEAVVSTEFRASYFFEADAAGDRPLAFLQGGPGWDVSNESTLAGLIKVGGGYRVALSPAIKLDFLLGWQFLYLQPKVYEDQPGGRVQIANEYIGRNNEWVGALTWGASLSF